MRPRFKILLSICFLCTAISAPAQVNPVTKAVILADSLLRTPEPLPAAHPIDSLEQHEIEHNEAQVDSLEKRSKRSRFNRFIYNAIFIKSSKNSPTDDGSVIDEAATLRQYDGKTIGSITLNRGDVYPDKSNWFRSLANGMHVRTLPATIERDLLFRTGDIFDATLAVSSNQIISDRGYIADSRLVVEQDPSDSTVVHVTINTEDNWTIAVDGERNAKWHEAMGYIYDVNFFGSGDRVGIRTHLNYNSWKYGGNVIDYTSPNFLGSFYTANLSAGRAFDDAYQSLSIDKAFILPTDYEMGLAVSNNKESRFKIYNYDERQYAKVRAARGDIWWGRSRFIDKIGHSLYMTARYGLARFSHRPDDTDRTTHPIFHNYDEALFGIGLYREKFYASAMIYGYGYQEYIAAGQKAEIVCGYSWQEFGNYAYAGAQYQRGEFTNAGYFRGAVSLGSYIDVKDGKLWRSLLSADLRWFSNLLNARRHQIRQFVMLNYTKSWHNGTGAGSLVIFDNAHKPATFDRYVAGSGRLLLNTETVLFTPLRPFGFRIALFGFIDAGTIGMRNNPFHNDFYGTAGIGIRFKNERMVFPSFQIRLGVALNKNGVIHNDPFKFSTEQRIAQYRFTPSRPEKTEYE